MSRLLEVIDLEKHFGRVHAVNRVSFAIDAGETLALVGESGCGKSTTGRCVLRLVEPTAGEIRFGGRSILPLRGRKLGGLRAEMQIVFQDPFSALDPRMRIDQTIGEPLFVHRACPRRETSGRVAELLELVGLPRSAAHRFPHELSGGQCQRVGIARALALRPKLLVADEPVSALDVSVQAQVLNLMRDLQDELGLAYLFISHDLSVVRHVAHRAAVMYLGRLVEIGPVDALFGGPLHPYTRALLSAVPVPDPSRKRGRLMLTGEVASARDIPPGCAFHPRCPHADDQCQAVSPELRDFGGDHQAACHRIGEIGQTD